MLIPFLYNGVEVIVECHSNHTGNECKHSYHGKKGYAALSSCLSGVTPVISVGDVDFDI